MFATSHRVILVGVLLLPGVGSAVAETRMKLETPEDKAKFAADLRSPEFRETVLNAQIDRLERENARLRTRLDVYEAGHPLSRLREGMRQERVERVLGQPARLEDGKLSKFGGGTIPIKVAIYH